MESGRLLPPITTCARFIENMDRTVIPASPPAIAGKGAGYCGSGFSRELSGRARRCFVGTLLAFAPCAVARQKARG